ncbi:MAG: DUF4251 domain-containing protein [Muribaculaceae bacterium]
MNNIVKLFIIILATSLMAACSSSRLTSQEKTQMQQRRSQYVLQSIEKQAFVIDIDRMLPKRGRIHSLSYGYGITVKADTLVSMLPYLGQAYSLPYGGGNGLNFSSIITNRSISRNEKKMLTTLQIFTKTNEDTFQYTVRVFDNGRTSIEVRSRLRDPIQFEGMMQLPLELQ